MRARVAERRSGRVHRVSADGILASRNGRVLLGARGGGVERRGPRLAWSLRERFGTANHILERFLRGGVHHVVVPRPGIAVVVAGRSVTAVDLNTLEALGEPSALVGSRPLTLCCTRSGTILYGEYRGNTERAPIRVFASTDDGARWDVAHVFEGVRHVHGVYEDPLDGALWITTGDDDRESALWRATPDFSSIVRVVSGSQSARAIDLVFTNEALFFGSDTPREKNRIYRLRRGEDTPEALVDVGGSVFHGRRVGSTLLFATAVEPSPVNPSREAELWASVDGGDAWTRVATYPKDALHPKLFQYGQIFIAEATADAPEIWITPFATSSSGRSHRLEIEAS